MHALALVVDRQTLMVAALATLAVAALVVTVGAFVLLRRDLRGRPDPESAPAHRPAT